MKKLTVALLLMLATALAGCFLDDPWPTGTHISARAAGGSPVV